MIRTDRRIRDLFTAFATLALAAAMLALLVSPVQAQGGSAPLAPTGVTVEESHDSVVLTWYHLDDDDIVGYVILRWDVDDQAPGFAVLEENTGTTSKTYTDSSVDPDTRYIYQVKAINEHGTSPGSGWPNVVRTPVDPATETEPGQIEEGTGLWIGIDISPASIEQRKYGTVTFAVTGVEAGSSYSLRSDIVDENGNDADTCEGSGLGSGTHLSNVHGDDDAEYAFEETISKFCALGSYSVRVVWKKYREGVGWEYGGAVTEAFEVIPNDEPPRNDIERVDYIAPLYPDPPATHGPLLMGYSISPSPSQANVHIGIGGLDPDSDLATTDYVVSVRAVDQDNVPLEGCNQGPEVGGSFLIKIVPDSGKWNIELPTLSRRCASGLRIELLNGSFEYLGYAGVSGVWPIPRPPGANSPATGVPVISGTARVGETLTADTSGISDDDGLDTATFAYQWIRSDGTTDTEIAEATGTTYVVSTDDVDSLLRVRVSFTDDGGNDESLTSASTTTVSATGPGAPGSVDIQPAGTGELSVSWQEPASDGGATVTGYTVQWKEATGNWDSVADVSSTATTETSYTINRLSLGTEYAVRVIATNSIGDGLASAEETATADAQTSQQQAATQNNPATGAPSINGTPEVGQTLSVDTSSISDADGLANAAFTYQWIRSDGTTDTDISSATASTHTLVSNDEGKTVKVRVSFTDDGDNEETLTSTATAAVEAALTAELQGVPDSHDGSGTFTFRILFSEPVTVGYAALKQHSFQVSNATIKRAQRVNGRDDLRKFTVQPSSDAAVVLVLTATEDCTDEGAICTSDGNKRLSTGLEISVPGPAPANVPATGAPTISGTAQVGQTLTASTSNIADSDGLVNTNYSYQWVRNDGGTDADTQGETGSTYTLDAADEGKTVKVRVSFTDDAGNEETLTSATTTAVEARSNSPATGAPTISDEAQVGETLTADTSGIADADGLTNAKFRYQWLADDADISGATGSTYTLVATEEGKAIKVRVSFTDDGGNEESLTSAPTAMVSTPLTAGFQWMPGSHNGRDEFTIFIQFSEEIASSYVTLRDHALTVTGGEVVSADVFGYSDLWALVIDPDGNGDVTIALPITTDCSATGAVCTGGGKKLSNHIEHTVSGPVHANSVATGIPTITGTAQVGETLTAGTSAISDEDGLTNATFSYQWIRNDGGVDTEIQGATDSTYTLDHADAGKTVKVRVSFTDDAGNDESLTSTATTEVAAKPNSPATGVPAVSGTTQVGETLTADTSNIADSDGLVNATYAYQWLADDTDIAGATGSSYTLADADEGKAIKVEVSFTDNAGNAEAQTSAATAAIAGLPPEPLTAVIENAASSHDGTTVFTFELRLSEEFELSYVTLRDHAFTVEGGKVKKAQRMDKPSNIHWRITVEPDSSATVTVVLPVTTDCNAAGAICTEDGRMLSNRTEITAAGPSG